MSGFLKDIATVVLARGFVRASQLVSFVVLARFLTVEEFGWFGLITSGITLVVTLGSLGLRQSTAYHIGNGAISAQQGLGLTLGLFPLLAGISTAVIIYLYGSAHPSTSGLAQKVAIALSITFCMLITVLQGTLLARGDIKGFSATETAPRIILAILTLGLAAIGLVTLKSALVAYAIGFSLTAPWLLIKCLNIAQGIRLPAWAEIKKLISFGLIFSANLFMIFAVTRASLFVLGSYHGADAAGLLFSSVRVNEIALEIAAAVGLVLFSNTVRGSLTDSDFVTRISRISCLVFWTFTFFGILLSIFASQAITLIAGPNYSEAGGSLAILALALGAASANKVIYPAVAGRGKPFFGTPALLLGIIISASVAVLMVPTRGVEGAAIAISLGQLSIFISYIIAFKAFYGTPARDFLIPRADDVKQIIGLLSKKAARIK